MVEQSIWQGTPQAFWCPNGELMVRIPKGIGPTWMLDFYNFVDGAIGRLEDVLAAFAEDSLVEEYGCELLVIYTAAGWWNNPENIERLKHLCPVTWQIRKDPKGKETQSLL